MKWAWAVCLILLACSKSKEEGTPSARIIPTRNFQSALALVEKAKLQCAIAADCPENVALFAAARPSPSAVVTCTSFLVGEDSALTASHCLPFGTKESPELCEERVRFLFPAVEGKEEESVACGRVLGATERPHPQAPDLALVQLKTKVKRSAFLVSSEGVEEGRLYTSFKIHPGLGASGTLVKQECMGVSQTYQLPFFRTATDPVITVAGCPNREGNSGAPLVGGSGTVVALLQTHLDLTENFLKIIKDHILPEEVVEPLVAGTNLRCLKGLNGWEWDETCTSMDLVDLERPKLRDFEALLEPQVDSQLERYRSSLPDFIRFQKTLVKNRTLEREESMGPLCFEPLSFWIDRFRDGKDPSRLEDQVSLSMALPIVRSKLFFNRYTQIFPKVELLREESLSLEFSPQKLSEMGFADVRFRGQNFEIGLCSSEPTERH